MPALPAIANVVRIDLQFETTAPFGGCRTFWLYNGTPLTSAQVVAIAGHAQAGFSADFAALMSAQVTLANVIATDLSSNQGNVGANSTTVVGTRTGAQLPVDVAAMINHKIAIRYRGGKPRTYLPLGVATDVLSGKTWQPTFVSSVTSAWTSFQNFLQSGSYGGPTIVEQVCVHYYKGYTPNLNGSPWEERNVPKVDPNASNTVSPITSSLCNPIFGSQRRRLRSTTF